MTETFKAPWSKTILVFTIIVCLIVFVLVPILAIKLSLKTSSWFPLLIFILPMLFIILTFYAPVGYAVNNKQIIIRRILSNIVIDLSSVNVIRPVQRNEMEYTIRTFGVGGYFGSYGWFYNRPIGKFKGYITNCSSLILIDTGQKTIISPDRQDDFIKAVLKNRDNNS